MQTELVEMEHLDRAARDEFGIDIVRQALFEHHAIFFEPVAPRYPADLHILTGRGFKIFNNIAKIIFERLRREREQHATALVVAELLEPDTKFIVSFLHPAMQKHAQIINERRSHAEYAEQAMKIVQTFKQFPEITD